MSLLNLKKLGIQVTVKLSQGKAFIEIIREALSGNYDLVMKLAESEVTLKSIIFGSTEMQLFRLCPCPVWVIKPVHHTEVGKVMIAVDLLPSEQEKTALADNVIQWGKYLARSLGAELHVIHA